MREILNMIGDEISGYADILSEMLKVTVTIVDENMHRVAGTKSVMAGEIRAEADISHRAGILAHAIKTGTVQIVDNPREALICRGCPFMDRCHEKYNMSAPVLVDGEVRGAVSFLAANNLEQNRMLKGKDTYLNFLLLFTNLLSFRIREAMSQSDHSSWGQLVEVLASDSENGVLAFDRQGRLAYLNPEAGEILSFSEMLPAEAKFVPDEGSGEKQEYVLEIGPEKWRLSGHSYHIYGGGYSEIFVLTNGVQKDGGASASQLPEKDLVFGDSVQGQEMRKKLMRFAGSRLPVLISGESGTEKRELAEFIHEQGPQRERPFEILNCRTLRPEQMDAALFGINSSGNKKGRRGKLELAAGGTLLLEEISELPLTVQAKLIRALDSEEYVRTGGGKRIKLSARMIATTSNDLKECMESGNFLEELYYKLNVLQLRVPPLRCRGDEIQECALNCLKKLAKKEKKKIHAVTPEFWQAVKEYPWPGNLWELRSVMGYVVSMLPLNGIADRELLPESLQTERQSENTSPLMSLREMEIETIRRSLNRYGNSSEAKEIIAGQLGIGVSTLYRKIKQYGL